jgi:ATP-dependent protease ClpP protease subunit
MVFNKRGFMKIYITGEINQESMAEAHQNLDNTSMAEEEIEIVINSWGGCLVSGMALASRLRSLPCKVRTYVAGGCGSAATFIFLAGDERGCDEFSTFLFHEFWWNCSGNLSHKQKQIRPAIGLRNKLIRWISHRVGLSVADVKDQLITPHDVELTKSDAIVLGIVNK